jgi:CheY-like chemotaxis protein
MKKLIITENILAAFEKPDALFRRGYIEVHPARSAEEILELHRAHHADLIIAERELPVMGGAKLCSAIRGDARLRDVSVILACGGADAEAAACRDAGANAVVRKPVDPAGLFDLISELIVVPERKDMRVLLRVSVVGGDGASPFFASSENISTSGMLIETAARLSKDELVRCQFFIGSSELKAEARVARAESSPEGRFRYGVRFANLDAKALVNIEQFIRSRRRPAAPPA